jgi:hypothetical protein
MTTKATTSTDLPAGLRLFRDHLRAAIQRDIDHRTLRRARTRGAVHLGAAVFAVITAVSTGLLLFGGSSGARPAEAAILTAAARALTPPPGMILHDQAAITIDTQAPQPYELWAQLASPYVYRCIKFGHEFGWDGTGYADYDAASGTITRTAGPAPAHGAVDLAATLRALIDAGQAHVTGTTVLDGVPAYQLTVSGLGPGWSSGVANGTYAVAQSDYRPLLVQTTVGCATGTCAETVRFQVHEFLPATSANLALLDLRAQHPGARLVSAPPATSVVIAVSKPITRPTR